LSSFSTKEFCCSWKSFLCILSILWVDLKEYKSEIVTFHEIFHFFFSFLKDFQLIFEILNLWFTDNLKRASKIMKSDLYIVQMIIPLLG
jgi:hypothetical protein